MSAQQIDRLIASRGPALVTHNGGSFFSKEDIVVDLSKETKELGSSAFGPLTEINMGVKASTKFTPVGEFEHLGVLWPYGSTPPGTSIFGSADVPLLIQPLDVDQPQVRFHAAGISKMPDLNFTATDSLIGEVEIQMIGKNNTAVDNATRLFAFEDNDIDPDALPYDPAKLLVQPYALSWLSGGTWRPSYNGEATDAAIAYNANAATVQTQLRTITALSAVTVSGNYTSGFTVDGATMDPDLFTVVFASFPGGYSLRADAIDGNTVLLRLYPWANFNTREGIKVSFQMTVEEDTSDAIGHYDSIFRGLKVSAVGIPQGVSDADALLAAAVQGTSSVRGSRIGTSAHHLDISADGVFFRLYAAGVRKSGLVYSSSKQRIPAFEWFASRSVASGGVTNPLFYIGTDAPA